MSISKWFVLVSRYLERTWDNVPVIEQAAKLEKGWYVTEFKVRNTLKHIPELVIEGGNQKKINRPLIGYHTGRNRMLIYLSAGKLLAYDKAIEFDFLSRVSTLEGRLRVCLISFRYLQDFFSWPLVWHMLALQFKEPVFLSNEILQFYYPKRYDYDLVRLQQLWKSYPLLQRYFEWRYQSIKVAVVIEDKAQRQTLDKLAVKADAIIELKKADPIPADIDYVIPLQQTERLHPVALGLLKKFIRKRAKSRPDLIYSDHDYAVKSRMEAVLKPQPNPPYLYCYDYIGPAVVYAGNVAATEGFDNIMDDVRRYYLNIKLMATEKVMHLPVPLFQSHRTQPVATPTPQTEQTIWSNIQWQRAQGYNRLTHGKLATTPAVDLIIPTRDGLSVLKPCIDSILTRTSYHNYQIIIVDNDSQLDETRRYLEEIEQNDKVRVISFAGEFNYSAINNFAISNSKAEYIALVNNDIEVVSPDWLTSMMAWCQQDNVGAVGVKLLYSDGDIQHAGVSIGMGNAAGHIHRLEPGDSLGYQHRCVATQYMMAVTAACMLTPRSVFEQVGGLDDANLKIAYNDVDYCLKIEMLGMKIVWTPEAVLYHHESVSRGDDMSDRHIKRYFKELGYFQKKWKTKGYVDKYYNKHLRINDEGVYPQLFASGDEQLRFLKNKSN